MLVVVQLVTKDVVDNPDYDYPWCVCVDADGGGEEPAPQQLEKWRRNFRRHGQGDKPENYCGPVGWVYYRLMAA